jgi:hypothetical protein
LSHPERARLAELVVVRSDGERRRGGGYLVAPGWVLTADHVVADATAVAVWLGAPQDLDPRYGAGVVPDKIVRSEAADLALVPIEAPHPVPPGRVLLGGLDRSGSGSVPVVAAGFPRFKLRPAPDRLGVDLREVHYATGSIMPGSNVKTSTFELDVLVAPPDDPDPAIRSPWEGMSGAAVFASGRLIGVVGQHYPSESPSVLTVRPLAGLYETDDLPRWRSALPQVGESVGELAIVTVPSARELAVARAQRAAKALAPAVLVARDDEMAELSTFVGSDSQWRWVQGAAFAGKTALLSWLALHPPPDVDVAACFLQRTTGTASANYALDVLNRQLAAHAVRNYQPAQHLSQQRDDFFDLLDEAARSCAQRGRRLLVLVDGLDEDQTVEPGLAVSSWIPDTLPGNAWLLAASRAGVEIGLPEGHPLTHNIEVVRPSEAATEIEKKAASELDEARRSGGLVYDLLGLLAATQDGLSSDALTELVRRQGRSAVPQVEVVDTLRDRLGRSVLWLADPDEPDEEVLAFAHETLLDRARVLYRADLPRLLDRVLDWCREWALRAEAEADQVPRYVVQHYAERLADTESWTPRWLDLLQPAWARLRDRAPGRYLPYREDLARLMQTAHRVNEEAVIAGRPAPALAAAVAATIAMAEVESQYQATTCRLVAAWLESGRWSTSRTLQYLATMRDRYQRAVAIGTVAPLLARDTIDDVLELYYGLGGHSDEERGHAAFGVARLLVDAGRTAEAVRFAESEAAADRACEGCNAAAGALPGLPPAEAVRLLGLIRQWAGGLSGYNLWRFAERLTGFLPRQQVQPLLEQLEPGLDAGKYVVDLLDVPADDVQNLASALRVAAPWMAEQLIEEECRALLDSGAGVVLEDLAEIAPSALHRPILRRANRVAHGYRLRILAGLLVVGDRVLTKELLLELSPPASPLDELGSQDDVCRFLANLTRSGHGDLAIDYLETAYRPEYLEAIVEYLEPRLLERLVVLISRVEVTEQAYARAVILPELARRGEPDALTQIARGSWADADRFAKIAMGWLPAGGGVDLPHDSRLALAGLLIAVMDGHTSLAVALPALRSLEPSLVVRALTEVLSALPIDEYTVDDLIDFCAERRSDSQAPVERTRLVRAALRAVVAQRGLARAELILLTAESRWVQAQVVAECGEELITEGDGNDRLRLLSLIGDDKNRLIARAALVPQVDRPEEELELIAAEVGPGLMQGYAYELDVLEALPERLRPVLLEQALPDGLLDGSRSHFASIDTWAHHLARLVPALSRDQLGIVDRALSQISRMGGGPRSAAHVAIAIRWARLGDFTAFRSALERVNSGEDLTRVLASVVRHLPTEQLPDWYALTNRLKPTFEIRNRALLWSIARARRPDLSPADAWRILDHCLWQTTPDRAEHYYQPWQVLIDLAAFTKPLTTLGPSDVTAQLYKLLIDRQSIS